jgi:hypothetical protein
MFKNNSYWVKIKPKGTTAVMACMMAGVAKSTGNAGRRQPKIV